MLSKSGKPTSAGAPAGAGADFEGLLDAVPDAMVGVDRTGVIRFVNRQTESMFGYDPGALVGKLIETLVPESIQTEHKGLREGYVAAPRTRALGHALRLRGRRRDGSEFPADISLTTVGTVDDLLVIAAVRDMTARKKLEQDQHDADRRLASIEFSGDAVISSTLDGTITSWNPAAERLFGYASEEIIGRSGLLLSPKDRVEETGAVMARVRAGEVVNNFESFRVRKDGTVFLVSVTVAPIRNQAGAVVGFTATPRDVTEQRRAFEAAQRLAAIVENSDDAIVGKTLDGIITSWNPAAERMYGYTSEEIVGKPIDLLSRADEITEILGRISAGHRVERYETVRVRKDGTQIPVSLTISPICDPGGAIVGASTIAHDLTGQKQAARDAGRLTAAEDLVRTVMGSASIGIAITDLDGSFRLVNTSTCELLGYDETWFLAHRLDDLLHPDDAREALKARARVIAGTSDTSVGQLRLVRADGATVWVRRVAVLIPGSVGEPDMLMSQVEDITAEHEAQEALAYQVIHDPLTGLHNQTWIQDILAVDLRAAKRQGTSVATLFVGLDNFKVVNDSLGHGAGDEVIATVAARIVAALRPGDRVGRFSGDSFVIVVQDVRDVLDVERFAERVSASIAVDLQVQGHRIVPSASIGIAVSSSTSMPEGLLRDTDYALHRAKAAGRGRWQFFDAAMHAQAVARLTVEDQLRDAITAGQFVVYYQPIVTLAEATVVGHEALVRWAHPTRGLLSPADFLNVAEDSGLITPIGAQVLEQVAAMLGERPDLPGPISVNVSAVQLAAPNWLGGVTDTLAQHGVDPSRIVIEVTETAALSLSGSALNALTTLSGLGVGIHLDDFGTGYSSISVLRDLPVTGVKLDLRFVRDLTTRASQANALAHGLAGLVNGMNLTGIAEGIETAMQANILRAQGWRLGQGYFFGRPVASPVTDLFTSNAIEA